MNPNQTILITIDVEDWFQVENFKPWIPFETWDQHELRVERNVHRLLNLFDSIELKAPQLNRFQIQQGRQSSKLIETNDSEDSMNLNLSGEVRSQKKEGSSEQSSDNGYELKNNGQRTKDNGHTKKVKATFFTLGWLVQRLPHLIREIRARGHEIASHGYYHNLCNQQTLEELKKDLTDSKKYLEDIIGSAIFGYRAPSFAINNNILKIVEDCGYLYDSSYNSFSMHGRYGKISINGTGREGIAYKMAENFFELPISNLRLVGQTLPWGGGSYFRLLPWRIFKSGVNLIIKKDGAYLFYIHPWEIDPNQPKVKKASLNYKLRHYTNLNNTDTKLNKLIESFSDGRFITCKSYLKEIVNTS